MEDIFEFWNRIDPTDNVHPADRPVFDRGNHTLNRHCLPSNFMGPLKTAKVVLLFLSFGYKQTDEQEATTPKGQRYFQEMRSGQQLLPGRDDWYHAWKWWSDRTKSFGDWPDLRSKIAVLNIGAYHSAAFTDWPMLAALPSSRVCLEWAQTRLFPEAERGDRLVICLRAHRYWGLGFPGEQGCRYGEALFSAPVVRAGHMRDTAMRKQIIDMARAKLL